MNPLLFKVLIFIFSLCSLGGGLFLIAKPHQAIEIQKRFYARINWKIEPISMPREIRNTRIMGGFLIIVLLLTLTLLLT